MLYTKALQRRSHYTTMITQRHEQRIKHSVFQFPFFFLYNPKSKSSKITPILFTTQHLPNMAGK